MKLKKTDQLNASEVIYSFGGTVAAARLSEVSIHSVSEWREKVIPMTRLQFFSVLRDPMFFGSQSRTVDNRA